MRSVPEWIAKHDDQAIPRLVKLRIWARCDGKCYLTGRKIMPGDAYEFEHIIALCNGGQHRESNIAIVLSAPHKEKTARDRKEKAKVDRIRLRHLGIVKPRKIRMWRRFNGDPVYANRER